MQSWEEEPYETKLLDEINPSSLLQNPINQVVSTERRLYQTFSDVKTMSNKCKVECIDKQKVFCATKNFEGGYCCDDNESCPRSNICSNDNPQAPLMFKYVACPNVKACESKNIYPKVNAKPIYKYID